MCFINDVSINRTSHSETVSSSLENGGSKDLWNVGNTAYFCNTIHMKHVYISRNSRTSVGNIIVLSIIGTILKIQSRDT
jgi:hypothetical protein